MSYPKEIILDVYRDLVTRMFMVLFIISKNGKEPKFPPMENWLDKQMYRGIVYIILKSTNQSIYLPIDLPIYLYLSIYAGSNINLYWRGTWVAQWVKASAFGSGHDLGSWDPALHRAFCSAGSLFPPLSVPASLPTCDLILCQLTN